MSEEKRCFHCHEKVVYDYELVVDGVKRSFCCQGCQTVFQILNANDLSEYYELKQYDLSTIKPNYKDESFKYLDEQEFLKKYVVLRDHSYKFKFFLEGVHCVACLWLLEKLPALCEEVLASQLNMASSTLTVEVKEGGSLAKVASQIQSLGYNPHPILKTEDQRELALKENRSYLIKIGVAFAAAGNIMLYSFANYFGAPGFFKDYFNLFSFLCFIPVFFYSAVPFYKTAYGALKNGHLSIDVPIVIALFTGMGMGIYSFIFKAHYFYFDTLATLVLLLLFARYILKITQQKSLESNDLMSFFSTKYAIKKEGSESIEILTKFLKLGDHVVVKAGEAIPIDGKIIEGHSYINNSLITGEVKPEKATVGRYVFMGAKNLTNDILLEVSTAYEESRLTKTLREIESGWSSGTKVSYLSDRLAKNFVMIVFALAIVFISYFGYSAGFETAFSRTLSLIIITCPCALALTTPLALILGLTNLAKEGVIIKNEHIIENIANIKNIFFDKTGTLTTGEFEVVKEELVADDKVAYEILLALELRSHHPIAASIVKYLKYKNVQAAQDLQNWQELPGVGVTGEFAGVSYTVKSRSDELTKGEFNQIGLYKGEQLVLSIDLKDALRPGLMQIFQSFLSRKLNLFILSGDKKEVVADIAQLLPIKKENIFSEHTPEMKRDLVAKYQHTMMVGDGVNDAIALKAAEVGVAVRGSVEVSLRAADVYLSKSGVEYIWKLIKSSDYVIKIIYRNLIFSLIYNVAGVYLAFTGQVTPLVAAILMPLSSLSVLASTVLSTGKLKKMIS